MAGRIDVIDNVGCRVSPEGINFLVGTVLDAEEATGGVTVVFVEELHIADLNRRYRGLNEPTDILSFFEGSSELDWPIGLAMAEGPHPESDEIELGELVISPDVVTRYAAEEGNSVEQQMAWTLVHGTLHLLGYDHETDRGEMRQREQELLARFDDESIALLRPSAGA